MSELDLAIVLSGGGLEWPAETKRSLIERGRRLADDALGERA